jgi:hypothetical protein
VILRELPVQSYLPLDFRRFTPLVRDPAVAQYDAKGHELTCAAFFHHLIGASEPRRLRELLIFPTTLGIGGSTVVWLDAAVDTIAAFRATRLRSASHC